jgi:hypothetical protein
MSGISEAVPDPLPVLWWNGAVIAAGPDGPATAALAQDGDSVLAFCAFIEGLGTKRIRLFYHSPDLEHLTTTCPKGGRQTIRKALSPRFSALADPTTAWAAHRVRTNAAGTTTLLYIEPSARLARVRAALDDRKILLEAVFPILALLEEVPPGNLLDKPVIAFLHADEAAAVYWRTPEGDRHALFFDGPTAHERSTRELVTAFSIFRAAPVFTVVNAGSAPVDLEAIPQKPAKILSAGEFLTHAGALQSAEVSNFLPPESPFTSDRLCHAAALLLFLAAAALTGTYFQALRTGEANMALQRSEAETLESETAQLRKNKAQLDAANAVLDEAAVASPVKLRFLEALNRARPAQISIRSVVLNESAWTVTGIAQEGADLERGPYQSFLANFSRTEGWTLGQGGGASTLKNGEFTLNGTIP